MNIIHNPDLFTMPGQTREFDFGSNVSPRPVSSLYSEHARSPTLRPEPLASVQSLQSLDRWLENLLDTLAARYEERQALRMAWTASEESIRNLKYQFYISRGMRVSVQNLLTREQQRFANLEGRMRQLRDELDDLLVIFWQLLGERSKGKVTPVQKVCGLVQALTLEELEEVKGVVQEAIYMKGNFI